MRKSILALLLIAVFSFSSCERVNENYISTLSTQITSETSLENVSSTEISLAETTVPLESITESSTVPVLETTIESTTIETETESETETTTVSQTETTSIATTTIETTVTTETTTEIPTQTSVPTQTTTEKITIQTESPPENPSNSYGYNNYSAINYKEQKGVWISFLEYESILKNKSAEQFTSSINSYFDKIKSIGFNTVYVQVRSHGDAYYDSDLFPSGIRYTGEIDSSGNFDALEIMVKSAHDRKLSVHAWVNPMRLMYDSEIKQISDKYIIKKWYDSEKYNGQYLVKSGDFWYLNPAYSDVRNLIANGISEIVENYDVDGIQIDDYFYPTTSSSFDRLAFKTYGDGKTLDSYRMNNVDKMVSKLYSVVHSTNNSVVFGISPQGNIENNYETMYADVKKWSSSYGYCDYILPQIYFGFENETHPFADITEEWSEIVTSPNVKLVIGLASYKVGNVDNYAGAGKNEWINNSNIINDQITYSKTLDNYGGVALFRYDFIP